MSFTSVTEPQPSLAWQFESSNVDYVTNLQPSAQVSPGPAQLAGSAALVTNAPTSNTAVYFPSTGSPYMNLGTTGPTSFNLSTSNIFIEAWIYLTSIPSQNVGIFARNDTVTPANGDFRLFIDNTGAPNFFIRNLNSSYATGSPLSTGRWYHISSSWGLIPSSNTVSVFTDGTLNQSKTELTPTGYNSSRQMNIGYYNGGYFPGYIRDLRVVQGGIVPTTSFTPGAAPFSYALPSYVTGSGSVVFTLLGQFVTYSPGKYGQGISSYNNPSIFNSPCYITYNLSPVITETTGFTLSCWVNMSQLPASGQRMTFVNLSNGTGYEQGVWLSYDRYGSGTFAIYYENTGVSFTASNYNLVASVGTWYHICGKIERGTATIYVNGVAGTPQSYTTTGISYNKLYVLCHNQGVNVPEGLIGTLDDLRIYNQALTSTQVQSVYSSQGAPAPGRVMPQPLYAWDFNGTTAPYIGSATGTTTGTVSYNASGKYGQSLVIKNPTTGPTSANNINWITNSTFNMDSGFSVCFWLKVSTIPATDQSVIFYTNNSIIDYRYYISLGSSSTLSFTFYNNSTYLGPTAYTLSTNTWLHVVAQTVGGSMQFYINGTLFSSSAYAPSGCTLNAGLWLGGIGNYGPTNAEYDDLRIFDQSLTSLQVQAIYNQQGVPGRGAVQATPTYNAPLTGASNLNRIYGLQRLNTAYTGNIINIRRSSDNTNVNFTVDSTNTSLVTASGGQSLSSWLAAGTANVVIWYDQSGNGRNLTQLTNGNQPGFSATTGLLYATNLYMNFSDDMTITDASFSVGYIQRGYYGPGSSSPWYQQDMIVAGERGSATNDYGLVIGGSGLFGLGTGSTDGAASTIATNGTGVYSFMTCTRNSTTGQVLLYNGAGSGTSFTKNTGTLAGPNPTLMGKLTYSSGFGFLNADVSSFFMFNSVKSPSEISSIASRFVNSTFTASPVRLTGTPLFTQLSQAATSSAVGAFSLRAVNGLSPSGTVRAVQVRPQAQFPATGFTSAVTSPGGNQYNQTLTGYAFGGAGAYTSNCSSWAPDGNTPTPWKAFDYNTLTWWENNYFVSPGYNAIGATATSNAYSGSYTTIVSGSSVGGEWLQLGFPTAIVLYSYSMYNRFGYTGYRMPYAWTIAGSNDGTTWATVDSQTGIIWTSATQTFTTTSTTTYLYFRLIVRAIQSNGNTGQPVNIGQWTLNGSNASWNTDFYADRLGNLLTAPVTGQPLANWLGGATGYVTTWYDQSGAGNHATQATAANQPIITKATKGPGYSCVYTGNQWVSFGTLNTFTGTPFCISAVTTRTSNVANNGIIGWGTTTSGFTFSIEKSSATQDRFRSDFRKTTGFNNAGLIPVYAAGEGVLYPVCDYSSGFINRIYNKSSLLTTSGNGVDFLNTAITNTPSIGLSNARSPSNYYQGEIYEILVFTQSLYDIDGTSTITQIYNNQLSAYGT